MRRILVSMLVVALAASTQAQLGDLLKKIDPNKIRKGKQAVQAAREMTREFTEEEELAIGRLVAARVLAAYPLSKNEKLQKYVMLVGNTVAAYSSRPTLEWHFAVIEAPIVNAFSAPGGYIFITTGALKQLGSEAELASVLGHEIAHATQKHVLKEVKRANVIASSTELAQATASGSAATWLNDDIAKKISDVAYEKLFTTGLSRRDELEADKLGVELAAAAGYRAGEIVTFLEELDAHAGSAETKQLFSTHPEPSERISALKPVLREVEGEGVLLETRWRQWTAAGK